MMVDKKRLAVAIGVAVLALAVRLPGAGEMMTVDEENWMLRSGMFWHELFAQRDPGGTFVTSHPGAVTTWVAGAGIVLQESRLGIDIDTSNLRHFRRAAVLPVVVVGALLVGVMAYVVGRLLNWQAAAVGGVLLATEPYLVGMSQIVHVDMLLAQFMALAVLSSLVYWRERGVRWLVATGVFTGLAFATKLLPALWLGVFFLVEFVVWRRRRFATSLLLVLGVAMLTFYAAWPALWVKTGLDRYYVRDVATIATVEHVALSETEEAIVPASFYARTVAGRLTPGSLLMSVGVAVLLGRYAWARYRQRSLVRQAALPDRKLIPAAVIGWLLLFAVSYLLFITVPAKKADRYALPALTALVMLSGLGWYIVGRLLIDRFVCTGKQFQPCRVLSPLIAVALTAVLVVRAVALSPYAIAYNNPWLPDIRPVSQQGWGEGLDQAAAWLNRHVLAERLMVASWYPSVLRTYFNGKTAELSARDDHRVGYVVTYRNMGGRGADTLAAAVLDEYREREPAQVVRVLGEPYVWIYEVLGLHYFDRHVGELIGEMEVGQVVPVEQPAFSAVEIGFATFDSRRNTHDVILHVRESVEAAEDLRTVRVNASELVDGEYYRFMFEPIREAAGRAFFLSLTSPESVPGDAVTVWFTPADVLPGQLMLRRAPLKPGQTNREALRPGDLAYRIPDEEGTSPHK